jgi:hypothetical protein
MLCLFAGCASTPSKTQSQVVSINSQIAEDFLKTACSSTSAPSFASAWLDHERRYWEFYQSIYYNEPDFSNEREKLSTEHARKREQVCKSARSFLLAAPAVIQALSPRINDLMGVFPALPIYLASALQEKRRKNLHEHSISQIRTNLY